MHLNTARVLPDEELLARVKVLADRERGATVELVAHLAELETRNLHLAAGYGSMFAYCREALCLSEHEAYGRIEAARAARRFPVILDRLAQGAINLTAVSLLAPHLTAGNHLDVLESVRGLRKAQVEEVVARLAPKPDVPATVRKLPAPKVVAPEASALSLAAILAPSESSTPSPLQTSTVPAVPPVAERAAINPLSPDRYKLQLTISGGILEKLRFVKDLLRHANPSGDDAVILERALDALVSQVMRKRFALGSRTRASRGVAPGSHRISARVRRGVFVRDRGRCAFIGRDGRRCNERALLEFHHVRPHAHDGPPTVDNIELRCRRHNGYEWQRLSTDLRAQEFEWHMRQLQGRPVGDGERPGEGKAMGPGTALGQGTARPRNTAAAPR
jgi:hypothetical protein